MTRTPRARAASTMLDHFLHAAEILLAGDLDVEDVDRDAGALADRDRFLDAVAKFQAVVAQVRRVEAALSAAFATSPSSSTVAKALGG